MSVYVDGVKQVTFEDVTIDDDLTVTDDLNVGGVVNGTAGAATAEVAHRFGGTITEGLEIQVIDEVVTLAAAVSTDLTQNIPAGAVILGVQLNIDTAVVAGGTSTAIGIGPTGTPDKYIETAALTLDIKASASPDWAVLGGAEDVQVNLTDGAGTLGDTVASAGAVRVRIVFLTTNDLDDA